MSVSPLDRFTEALAIVLPTPVETSLLRACLGSGDSARAAWASHRQRVGDLRLLLPRDRRGVKKLMPLLLRAVTRNTLDADDALLTVLRTAHLRATLRSKTVRSITHDVLHVLTTDRIPHVVLDGSALAETVYDSPALRHCGTIDLLLGAGDAPRAARHLGTLTGESPDLDEAPAPNPLLVRHVSGIPIELRSHLLLNRDHPVRTDSLVRESRAATIAGISTRVLSPADALLDVCLRAFFSNGRTGIGWVADAWHVLERSPDLDWDLLLARSREGQLDLPLLVTLAYLSEHLEAPVPPAALDHLRRAAARTDMVRREKALAAAVAGVPAVVSRTLRFGSGWRVRFTIARWLLFPSPRYVCAKYDLSHAWQVPLYYLYRPLRFVIRRRGALRRLHGGLRRNDGTIASQARRSPSARP